MRGFDPQVHKILFDFIEQNRLDRPGKFLLLLLEVLQAGLCFRVLRKHLLFGLVAEERGAGNWAHSPHAAFIAQKHALAGIIRSLKHPEDCGNFFRFGVEKIDDLIGEEYDDAFEAAAGAEFGLKTRLAASGFEVLRMETFERLAKVEVC